MAVASETKELAYKIWCENSQNITECVRVMNRDHGFVVSRQSVTEWCEKFGWKDRAARAEAERAATDDASSSTAILASLLSQKRKYDLFFEGASVDQAYNQAMYAYNRILRDIIEVRKETSEFKAEMFGRFFRDLVEFLRTEDPDAAGVVARNFDSFTSFVRAKYVD